MMVSSPAPRGNSNRQPTRISSASWPRGPEVKVWTWISFRTVDRERLREAVRECVQLFEDPNFGTVIKDRIAPTAAEVGSDGLLDGWIASTLSIAGHTCGTCKMGLVSDPEAVVNQWCEVIGVEGLRVIDASVMPEIPRANTNATTIMIAERASEFIIRRS